MSIFNEPTFWFALISSASAGYTVISNLFVRSRPVSISLNWFSYLDGTLIVSFNLYNPSSETRSLMNIDFLFEDKTFQVTDYPDVIKISHSGSSKAYSDEIPINISPKNSKSVIVTFKGLQSRIIAAENLEFTFVIGKKSRTQNIRVTQKLADPEQLNLRLNRRFQ